MFNYLIKLFESGHFPESNQVKSTSIQYFKPYSNLNSKVFEYLTGLNRQTDKKEVHLVHHKNNDIVR